MRLALPLVFAAIASAAGLEDRIAAILNATPGVARTHFGILAIQMETGRVLVDRNSRHLFTPASNTKLYSTALALLRLGPDFRFSTVAGSDAPLTAEGCIAGNLRIIGGGDPTLSWRAYPYEKGPNKGEPLAAIEQLADRIAARGVKRIDGDIVGDDTRWPFAPYPEGWAVDDAIWEYGAPVSALTINDNAFQITLKPGDPGDLARLELNPPLEYYWIDNRVRTEEGERRLEILRLPASGQLRIFGRISPRSTGRSQLLAIDDPALFTALALQQALTKRGVAVAGRPLARHRTEDQPFSESPLAVELARIESRPLGEIVQVVNKVSQNLHAEILLREAAFHATREGTVTAGLQELKTFLESIGGTPEDSDFHDGSGLSRMNLIAPSLTIKLLAHMYNSPLKDVWIASLPIGGEDGTLEKRFAKMPGGARVRAKTGSLSHVNSLGGYIDSKTYGMLAVSIMTTGANAPAAETRAAIDKIAVELAK